MTIVDWRADDIDPIAVERAIAGIEVGRPLHRRERVEVTRRLLRRGLGVAAVMEANRINSADAYKLIAEVNPVSLTGDLITDALLPVARRFVSAVSERDQHRMDELLAEVIDTTGGRCDPAMAMAVLCAALADGQLTDMREAV